MTTDPRARWAEVLRVPADATAEAAAAAFLRALPDEGFLPPAARVAAANALAGTAAPVGRDPDADQLLRDDVDTFAAGYWALPPADRLTAWAELSRRGAPADRLRELEPGLDVAAAPLADLAAEELAALVRALFVLAPRPRAVRRNQWLCRHAADAGTWRAALAVVRRDAPALAALEPLLGAVLAPGSDAALAAFVEGASAAPAGASVTRDVADFTERTREYERAQRTPPPAARGGWTGPGVGGAIFGLFILVKVLALLGRSDGPPVRNSPPAAVYNPSGARPYQEGRTFTAGQVADFEQHERALAAGASGRVAPSGYGEWVLAGRPRGAWPALPGDRSVYLGDAQIRECQAHERTNSYPPPVAYSDWVKAGRPAAAGTFRIPNPAP